MSRVSLELPHVAGPQPLSTVLAIRQTTPGAQLRQFIFRFRLLTETPEVVRIGTARTGNPVQAPLAIAQVLPAQLELREQ